ncbi:MAG TPA: hypothetical protein VGK32_06220 [Vicinamibacterales bacterium]
MELKVAAEARRDRLLPLLAAAVLESRALALLSPEARPLAVVAAPRLPERVIKELFDYASRVAPDAAVGVMDLEGRAELRGPGLERLNSSPDRHSSLGPPALAHQPFDPFSDLNQWMLKVLLAPRLPGELLNAQRASISGAAQLADVARVSVPSASRLVRYLNQEGWLDEVAPLRLVRIPELLRRWRAPYVRPPRDMKMRWLIPGKPGQLLLALGRYQASGLAHDEPDRVQRVEQRHPRACLGLFSAANALGFGHVHGVPQHLYLEHPDPFVLEAMGLVRANVGEPVHVIVRIPRWPESVFRGAVDRKGVLASDIVQIWLDVSEHPARGAEQAKEIWMRAFRGAFGSGEPA